MSIFAIVAVIAISAFAIIEVLTAYQKYQLKQQFLRDMDKKDLDKDDTVNMQ